MADVRLFDDAGAALPSRIELVEASGPVSPRHRYTTSIIVEAGPELSPRVVSDRTDAAGAHHEEHALERAAYESLFATVLAALPLGADRDLVGDKRDRKGVSFNHVTVSVESSASRLDYLLSQVDADESDNDAAALAVVTALKNLQK